MARRPLPFLTGLSLLLCVAVVALSLASLGREDVLTLGGGHRFAARSAGGGLELEWVRRYELRPDHDTRPEPVTFAEASTGRLLTGDADEPHLVDYPFHESSTGWYGPQYVWRFEATKFDGVNGNLLGATDWTTAYRLAFPHWAMALLLGARPAWVAIRRLRRRRRKSGFCAGCGYDLRATPGRCPECGNASAATPM